MKSVSTIKHAYLPVILRTGTVIKKEIALMQVRRQSYREYRVFKNRWKKAAEEDGCFTDPYPDDEKLPPNQTTI